jgi:hypothetical protein
MTYAELVAEKVKDMNAYMMYRMSYEAFGEAPKAFFAWKEWTQTEEYRRNEALLKSVHGNEEEICERCGK